MSQGLPVFLQVSYVVEPMLVWLEQLLTPSRDHVLLLRPRGLARNIGTESVQSQRMFAACMQRTLAAGCEAGDNHKMAGNSHDIAGHSRQMAGNSHDIVGIAMI